MKKWQIAIIIIFLIIFTAFISEQFLVKNLSFQTSQHNELADHKKKLTYETQSNPDDPEEITIVDSGDNRRKEASEKERKKINAKDKFTWDIYNLKSVFSKDKSSLSAEDEFFMAEAAMRCDGIFLEGITPESLESQGRDADKFREIFDFCNSIKSYVADIDSVQSTMESAATRGNVNAQLILSEQFLNASERYSSSGEQEEMAAALDKAILYSELAIKNGSLDAMLMQAMIFADPNKTAYYNPEKSVALLMTVEEALEKDLSAIYSVYNIEKLDKDDKKVIKELFEINKKINEREEFLKD